MFKRFQVLDLFYGENHHKDVKEWIAIENRLPESKQGIYRVKLENGDQTVAYYCEDKLIEMMHYFDEEPSYWWSSKAKLPLYNVTHWGIPKDE